MNKEIIIIVAHDENRLIGSNGKLPWHIREDLQLFKKNTVGNTVIMGRNTWESINCKPLPNRQNIIISTTITGENVYSSLEDAINNCSNEKIFIIGGAKLYEYALKNNLINKILLSKIKGSYSGDVYFPELNKEWNFNLIESFEQFDFMEGIKSL